MKRKSGFIVREIAGKTVAVAVGSASKDFHGIISLNSTGLFIWNLLENETSEENIVENLLKTYDVDKEKAASDVKNTLEILKNAGIIVE